MQNSTSDLEHFLVCAEGISIFVMNMTMRENMIGGRVTTTIIGVVQRVITKNII